jgi:hypothetical protein
MSDKRSGLQKAAERYGPMAGAARERTRMRQERLAPGTRQAGQANVKVNMADPLTRFLLAHGLRSPQ